MMSMQKTILSGKDMSLGETSLALKKRHWYTQSYEAGFCSTIPLDSRRSTPLICAESQAWRGKRQDCPDSRGCRAFSPITVSHPLMHFAVDRAVNISKVDLVELS